VHSNLEGGKVHDGINAWVLQEDLLESFLIGHIDLVEGGSLSADELDTIDCLFRRVVEIVDDHDIVAGNEEFECREGADVARSSNVVTLAIAVDARTRP